MYSGRQSPTEPFQGRLRFGTLQLQGDGDLGGPFWTIQMLMTIGKSVITLKTCLTLGLLGKELPMNKLEFMVEPNDITLFESTVKSQLLTCSIKTQSHGH